MIATKPLLWSDFESLWRDYHSTICTYIYRRVSDSILAEDLTSEVFLKAIEAICNGHGSNIHVSGWLHRIARNLIIDYYRQKDRRKDVSIDDVWQLPDPKANPVLAAERAADAETLHQAMKQLTDEQAQVLFMRYWEGCEFEEIAEIMDKGESAIKGLRHRGCRTLNRQLDQKPVPVTVVVEKEVKKSVVEILYDTLLTYGPMRAPVLAEKAHYSKVTVNDHIGCHPDLFVVVDYVTGRGVPVKVWGLVGIHDKETA